MTAHALTFFSIFCWSKAGQAYAFSGILLVTLWYYLLINLFIYLLGLFNVPLNTQLSHFG